MSFIPIVCPPGSGSGGAGADVEQLLLCDVLNGEIVGTALAVYEYDSDGNPVGPPIFVDPDTGAPYVAQGVLQPCPDGSVAEFVLCDIQPDGSSTQFIRKLIQGPTGAILEVQDQLIDGSVYVPTGTVALCDPYTTCTPTADQDLNAECGPGEAADQVIIQDDASHPLANSVFMDDPAADPLCGGQWDNPAPGSTFQVDETFRNATFDQPGPVLQGTGPTSAPPTFPLLTADPANAGEGNPAIPNDAAGAGWLRMSDLDQGTNGIWQVPGPFSTAQGMTASVTFSSHDGTTPGGDGLAFVFTDGSVAPQSAPIGGFGNLGLQNWEGGYIAVVLDEYGQTCTCQHSAPPIIDPNPGPCGFCTNTISIQLAGAARVAASCQCCTIAQTPTAPKAVNLTTRSQPGRLYVSIIEEAGQTYVSAGIDWNDGNGVVQYFDRVNVTTCAGPAPANLRMALYGGSGGSFRAVKEYQDAQARPAGESHWRAFPITTDAIPACTSLVNIEASVDVTFNSDTQTTGNGDPEAYFWLVNEATNTVLDRAVKSSNPAQVGIPTTLTINAAVAPADVPNLRIYVGSENRDQAGEYDTLWENLEVSTVGTGCPAPQRRTLEISARCPIPVILAGGGEGGGGTTVVNTPATFEDAAICMTVDGLSQGGFRREVRAADGTVTVTFLGADGLPQTPTSWFPGGCIERDSESFVFCDDNGPFIRTYIFDENGNILSTDNFTLAGAPYAPVGTIVDCPQEVIVEGGLDVEYQCFRDNTNQRFNRAYVFTDATGVPTVVGNFLADGSAYVPVDPVVPCDAQTELYVEQEILCDANGDRFIRVYFWVDNVGGSFTGDFELDGTTPFVPVEPVGPCGDASSGSVYEVILCDITPNPGNPPQVTRQAFIRKYFQDANGVVTNTVNLTLGGTPYVVQGTVGDCDQFPELFFNFETLCDSNGTRFIRQYVYQNDQLIDTHDVDFDGNPFVPVGAVGTCPEVSADRERICYTLTSTGATVNLGWARHDDSIPNTPQTPNGIAFFDALGNFIDPTLDGFTQVICQEDSCCPIVLGTGCWDDGVDTGTWVSVRDQDGNITITDPATGLPVTPANVIACPADPPDTVRSQGLLLAAAGVWTPGSVVGTLTSVSFTVLTGTADVVDNDGTALNNLPAGVSVTWSAEDNNTLVGPQSITADAASSVLVVWTER